MTASQSTDTSNKNRSCSKVQVKAPIEVHRDVTGVYRQIIFESPEIASRAEPGQFMHVLCGDSYDPLLRRPFSIHNADPETGKVSMLYEIRGRGTALLAEKKVGEELDILGVFGNGFGMPENPDKPIILVAGGIGVPPICFLARRLAKHVNSCTSLIGAASEDRLLCTGELEECGHSLKVCTDDGSAGKKGFVTVLLQDALDAINEEAYVFACGPIPMLAAVAKISTDCGAKCRVSMEAKMACGVGACMSCVIKVKSDDKDGFKYVRVCKEGPVFDANEVIWK